MVEKQTLAGLNPRVCGKGFAINNTLRQQRGKTQMSGKRIENLEEIDDSH